MARSFNGSTQYLRIASGLGAASTPLTMACWFYSTSSTTLQTILESSVAGAGSVIKYRLILRGDLGAGSKTLQAQQNPGNLATSTAQYTANTWMHACGVFSATNSRTVYLDGGSSATDTTSGSMSGVDQFLIGAAWDAGSSTYVHYTAGYIAEVGVWNVALTSAEVASLAKGFTPPHIRPASLVAYYPLGGHYGQLDVDRWKNRYDLTPTGSPTWADHPRVVYPRRSFWFPSPIPAAPTS